MHLVQSRSALTGTCQAWVQISSDVNGKGKGIYNVSLWGQTKVSDDFYSMKTLFSIPSPGIALAPRIARTIKVGESHKSDS